MIQEIHRNYNSFILLIVFDIKKLFKAINDDNENVVNKVIETLMETDSNIKFNITYGL